MKTILSILIALVLVAAPVVAQQIVTAQTPGLGVNILFPVITTTGNTGYIDVSRYGVSNHMLVYTVTGSTYATAVTVQFECSTDGRTSVAIIGTGYSTNGGRLFAPDTQCSHILGRVVTQTGSTGIIFSYVGTVARLPVCNAVRKTQCSN